MKDQKPSSQSTLKKFIIAFSIAFVLICVYRVFKYKPPRSQMIRTEWAKQTFTPIAPTEDFKTKLSTIPIVATNPLTSAQANAIRQAAFDMAVAFNGQSYEAYRKFRTPVPPKEFNSAQIETEKQYCKMNWKNPTGEVPSDPEGIFKRFWEVQFLNKYVNASKVKNSTIGKPFWDGISIPKSQITVEEFATMPPPFKEFLSRRENTGTANWPSSFIFSNTPESILEKDGKLTCATVQIHIKYPEPEVPSPVYCRYYWDEATNVWLPMDFGLVVSGMIRTREPVF